jgi:hypothetical protein
MPVILLPKDYDRWLTPGDTTHPPLDLLRAFPAEEMKAWEVDRKVGNEERYAGLHRTEHVIDYSNPPECGGADAPYNMQWQTIAEGKAKDIRCNRIGHAGMPRRS